MVGKDSLQGAHHEAQKSTSTTLPFKSGSFPSSLNLLRSGKVSSTLMGAPASEKAAPIRAMKHPKRRRIEMGLGNDMFIESASGGAFGFECDATIHVGGCFQHFDS